MRLRRSSARSAIVALAALAFGPGPVAAENTIVTALSGSGWVNGAALEMHQSIADEATTIDIETGEDGSCTLLRGATALIQLCGKTKLKIHGSASGGGANEDTPEVIEVLYGELRVTTSRGRSDRRLEIRTPTAVARPFTTTLHVFVEPTFGGTIVSSLQGRALVVSSDPEKKRSALLNTGQRVDVREGEVPGGIQKFSEEVSAKLSGCFSAESSQVFALQYDSTAAGALALEQIAAADMAETADGISGAPYPAGSENRPGPTDADYFDSGCNPTSCQLQINFPSPPLPPPPTCGPIPSEGCIPP